MRSASLSIYAYSDYRLFLADWLALQKRNPRFSFRAFAKRAGFKAHNILQLVVQGKRGISLRSVPKYAKALGLDRDEAAYLEQLVLFSAGAETKQRVRQIRRLQHNPQSRRILEQRQLAIFRQWLTPVVCEATRLHDFVEDAPSLTALLGDRASAAELGQILRTLVEQGMLARVDGRLLPGDKPFDTGDGVVNGDLFSYHQAALAAADDALWSVPPAERSFDVLTLALTEAGVRELRQMLEEFTAEVLKLTDQPGPRTQVIQVGLQMFPVTKAKRKPRR